MNNTSFLPATVTILDLTPATTITAATLIEAVQTTNGVAESVSVSLGQIASALIVTGPFATTTLPKNQVVIGNGTAPVFGAGVATAGLPLVGNGTALPPSHQPIQATAVLWTPTGAGGAVRTTADVFMERGVSIVDYGASTALGGAANATAIMNAMAAYPVIYIPQSNGSFVCNAITVPSSVRRIHGEGTLYPATSLTQGAGVLNITNSTGGLLIENISVLANVPVLNLTGTVTSGTTTISAVSGTTGITAGMQINGSAIPGGATISSINATSIIISSVPTTTRVATPIIVSQPFDAIQIGGSRNVTIRNTVLSGRFGIEAANCDALVIQKNTITSYVFRGIDLVNAATHSSFDISGNQVSGGILGSIHGIAAQGGSAWNVIGNRIFAPQYAGITLGGSVTASTNDVVIANNVIENSIHEAIIFNGVGSRVLIIGNECSFDATSIDCGITIDGQAVHTTTNVSIVGNGITSPNGPAININANTGSISRVNVIGNRVVNPNALNGDTIYGGAVTVFDSGATLIYVHGNEFSDTAGNMKFQTMEATGVVGVPNLNNFGPNYGPAGTLGTSLLLGAGSLYSQLWIQNSGATQYNIARDSAGNNAILIGGGGTTPDLTTYYRNGNHIFQNTLGTTWFTITGGGASLGTTAVAGTGVLLVNTSVITPLVIGGSAATSTLTLQGSTATTSSVQVYSTGFVNIGPNNAVPDGLLTVNANTSTPAAPTGGTLAHIVSANSSAAIVTIDAFGTVPGIEMRQASGTLQAPQPTLAGVGVLGAIRGFGWDGTAYRQAANFQFVAVEAFNATSRGTAWRVFVTAAGTTTLAEAIRVSPGLALGTTTDPGLGSIIGIGKNTVGAGTAPVAGGTTSFGYFMSSAANLGFICGTAAPTVNAATGTLYVNNGATNATSRLYINTNGTGGWANFTASA